jgi:hypothetical protein
MRESSIPDRILLLVVGLLVTQDYDECRDRARWNHWGTHWF